MHFFPDATFGWIYYGLMLTCLLALVATDLRIQRLPNALTIPMLLLGLVMNIVRGAWLGNQNVDLRFIGIPGALGGGTQGLMEGLAGACMAFTLFVVLWQMGKCGAGDVKMMAAVGTWVGYVHFFFVFAGTIVAVLFIMLVWWSYAFATRRNPGLKLSYAIPCFISLSILMPWLWRRDLW
ncbi:MAG: A24 family peptidase [Gemmatales bacterium]